MPIMNDLQEILGKVMEFGEKFNYSDEIYIENTRKIFSIEESESDDEDIKIDVRFEWYKEMISMLNKIGNTKSDDNVGANAEQELKERGILLRALWHKHEDKLRVHEYKSDRDPHCEEIRGVYGVIINFWDAVDKDNSTWVAAYHYVFHEFFHNVFDSAVKHAKNNGKYARLTDATIAFGKAISDDIDILLKEENDNSKKATQKRLNNLTYRTDKKHKAVLYDFIGAVLYRGMYGCYPPNSKFYTDDGKRCELQDACMLKIDCKHDKLFGHDIDTIDNRENKYWGKKTSPPTQEFLQKLGLEAFAQMAAEAIVNPKAYEKIMECLPESCGKFERILKEMLSDELKELGSLF